jgi:hypothetical protein
MTPEPTMWMVVLVDPDKGGPEIRFDILSRPRRTLDLRVWMASDQDHPQTRTGGSCGRPESTRWRTSMTDGGWGTNRCLMMEWTCQRSFRMG